MMKKRVIDLALACICLAVIGITLLYSDQTKGCLLYTSDAADE